MIPLSLSRQSAPEGSGGYDEVVSFARADVAFCTPDVATTRIQCTPW